MAPSRNLKPVARLRKELIEAGEILPTTLETILPPSAAKTNKEKRKDKIRAHRAAARAELTRITKRTQKEKHVMAENRKKWVKKMLLLKKGRLPKEDEASLDSVEVVPVSETKNAPEIALHSSDDDSDVLMLSSSQNGGASVANGVEEQTSDEEEEEEDQMTRSGSTRGRPSSKMNDSRAQAKKLLQWLLDPIPVADFMKNIFEQRPLHVSNRRGKYYKNLFSTKAFDGILRKKEVWFGKSLDVVKCINGVKKTFTPENDRANPSRVWGFFKDGCSLRMLNPQTFSLPVWRMCSMLTEYFNSFVGCNMYLTPAGTQGFAAHYDDIEAFILQIEGKKHWKVYNPLSPERTLPRLSSEDFLPSEIGEPVLDVVLQPGDLLYMPRGFVHHGKAADDVHSLHLTISSHQKHSWGDFLMKLMPAAVQAAIDEDIEFRRSLPVDFFHHVGSVHSDAETPQREDIFAKVQHLMAKLMRYAPVDGTADQKYLDVLEESLPPVLSEGEKSCSVHRAGEPWIGAEHAGPVALDFNIGVRLVRFGSVRLVGEDDEVRLYHNVENSRVYREVGSKYLVLSEDQVDVVEALIHNYPQYVKISDLPNVDRDRAKTLKFVTLMYETGLLLTDAPVLAS